MLEAYDIPAVPEISGVTPEMFGREIMTAAKPVLMKGLVKDWPAVAKGRESPKAVATYIKAMDQGMTTTVLEAYNSVQGRFTYAADMADFNFNKRNKTISAGIDQLMDVLDHPNPPYIYIQSTPTPQYLPRFAVENRNPLLPPAITPRIWISNATRAQTHNDNDYNIACVIAGRRRFTLFPPEQLPNLYIGPMDHNPSGRAISLASLEEPDFERFTRLEEAIRHAQIAELEPGDALYVPRYWWHHVQSLDAFNVLINYWWGTVPAPEHPLTAFQAALLALKDLPAPERAYWKTMFDHYIFQTDGDPLAHIPTRHQGGLGPLGPSDRVSLIKRLQQIFIGRG